MTEIQEEHSGVIISQQRSSVNYLLFFSLQVKKSGENPTLDNFSFGNRSEGLD